MVDRALFRDAGCGVDAFGMDPAVVERALQATRFFYERYFRVSSFGAENIPRSGGAIIAANHSGMIPIDGVMLYSDIVRSTDPPRIPRVLMDYFVPRLPFVGTFLARTGAVSGTRRNVRRLLTRGELVIVFPEGVPGVAKTFVHAYELQKWRVGHAEMAIRHQVPVVPVAIIGAEEQWPVVARIDRFSVFGIPYVPIPLTPVPLPVHYRIYYGKPLVLHENLRPGDADDPDMIASAASRVEGAVRGLIEQGLADRNGVFA